MGKRSRWALVLVVPILALLGYTLFTPRGEFDYLYDLGPREYRWEYEKMSPEKGVATILLFNENQRAKVLQESERRFGAPSTNEFDAIVYKRGDGSVNAFPAGHSLSFMERATGLAADEIRKLCVVVVSKTPRLGH